MIGLMMLAATTQINLGRLQTMCATDRDSCSLYILGVTEGVRLGAGVANDARHFCIPDDVTQAELTEVVLRMGKVDLLRTRRIVRYPPPASSGPRLLKTTHAAPHRPGASG